jgi:co-chaperonin GroES (HSP10)
VKEKEKVRGGFVVKVGPGYPMPDPNSVNDEPWSSTSKSDIKYIPLQAQIGDYAIFLNNSAVEIEFENKHYLVVPQSAILVLMRDELPHFDLK